MSEKKEKNRHIKYTVLMAEAAVVFLMALSLEILPKIFFEGMGPAASFISVMTSPYFILSIAMTAAVYITLRGFLGNVFGRAAAVIVYMFFFIGNFVKLKYHDGIFKPMDVFQIQDFMEIVVIYVPIWALYILAAAIIVPVVYIIIKKRRYFAEHKPRFAYGIVGVIMVAALSVMLNGNVFKIFGFELPKPSADTKTFTRQIGLVPYSYMNFGKLSEIIPKPDENYGGAYMERLRSEFDSLHKSKASDTKPDVIFIMDESMFDVTKVGDVDFSMDVCANMKKYKKGDIISPRYGGGTGSVEFEALTGMSNFFFLDNSAPYVTYWKDKNSSIPGLAYEFSKNGYETTAIHPNSAKMYNRESIYSYMGFDNFINTDNTEFSERADDGYVKDIVLADVIEEQLDSSEEPQFIFAVTIENHTLYNSKYKETEVKLSSDKLDKGQLHQLEQYSQGVLGADRLIEKMVEYTNRADRPTLLYIWGDHLPALSAFNRLGFIRDKYSKYSTPVIACSNYRDIAIPQEYITTNQLAPQILRDAEIDYSSYFDYIYSLREGYPVIQREFSIDPEDEKIKLYGEVQYDVLFGEKYLVK